ncbi:putative sigma factor [Alkaliphilus metalliredigens QYMF]|uniref:Putative sigma factor n=1 Tax=Alkaliphilus metalliredigens (strain QYMF) TaxID=293826 RepID=A6TRB7_ALKMQ|nr:hypothetical protein [Alkaliphilus metalliredigens]ABR48735.1 putative sigma factor [Alkaliphilus metalliredigens QYMF]
MEEMNYRQVEGILYNYKIIKASIENYKLKLENLELEFDIDDGMKGISYGEPTSKTNKINRTTENNALKNIERKDRIKRDLERKISLETNKIKMVDNALDALSDVERTIINMFYIENLEWYKVAGKVCYSEGWCKEKRKESINRILFTINGKKQDKSVTRQKHDD